MDVKGKGKHLRRMERVKRVDKARKEVVLRTVREGRQILEVIRATKNYFGQLMRRECYVVYVMEGIMDEEDRLLTVNGQY